MTGRAPPELALKGLAWKAGPGGFVVEALDAEGKRDEEHGGNAVITQTSGPTMSGTLTVAFEAGVAEFLDISATDVADGVAVFDVTASMGELDPITGTKVAIYADQSDEEKAAVTAHAAEFFD